MGKDSDRIDVDKPLWDTSTFVGRFKHFWWFADPRTVIVPTSKLYEARHLVELYRQGKEPPGTTREEIYYAMKLNKVAFHPDSGELQNVVGRMSFQAPGKMILMSAMLIWYKSLAAVLFWQWALHTFAALVNYTNRNANSPITVNQLAVAYVLSVGSAMVAASSSKSYFSQRFPPLFQRFVPMASLFASSLVAIPVMRQNELMYGIAVKDEKDVTIGRSRVAPAKAITQVVISRNVMAIPVLLGLPIVVNKLMNNEGFRKATKFHAPFQAISAGTILLFSVPLGCALFNQRCKLSTSVIKTFEPRFYKEIVNNTKGNVPPYVYFNKGL